jgi:SAM-dependent methyltransferase
MTSKPAMHTASYDNPDLYASSSTLRQLQDATWVFNFLPDRPIVNCLDVGCGNGAFLDRLVQSGRVSGIVAGFDKSPQMAESAQARLRQHPAGIRSTIAQADALSPPTYPQPFGLVSMLAVLHWLYPQEDRALRWIASILDQDGEFCLTTYHPTSEGQTLGGTDDVVIEALDRIGLPRELPPGFIPMGTRARPKTAIERLLRESFRIVATLDRPAVMRVNDPQGFIDYFRATFGAYYLQVFPAELEASFLPALGQVAMERMERLGHVTSIDIRMWICRRREG